MLHITCDGQEISVSIISDPSWPETNPLYHTRQVTEYDLLTGKRSYVRWIRVTGCFAHDKLCGFRPVM
jgi:hypothetical protein